MNQAKALRIDRGLTRQQACEGAGISAPTLRRIEEGDGAEAPSLKKLGDFYAVPAHTLLLGVEQTPLEGAKP